MRASAIAESLQSDPSTVSRQVATLVREGFLERRADPEDGRASILVLTPKADAAMAQHEQRRIRHFATMLAGWNEPDLRQFSALLRRFTTDFDTANSNWLPERSEASRPATEGNN